jgi:hypothetical protein
VNLYAGIHKALRALMSDTLLAVGSMDPTDERAGMLLGMKANAPAPAFQAALETVRPHLTQREWEKLELALG